MKKKEYEMPDEYKRQLEGLTYLISERDEYARIMPTLPPDIRAKAMPAFRQLNDSVEILEQKLAEEYERFQAEQRDLEEEFERIRIKYLERTVKQFIFIKKNHPPKVLQAFEAAVIEDKSPEEEKEFYDLLAIREAEDSEELNNETS
jgi:hypothetical protein